MKVSKLIEELKQYNPEAEVDVIVHNQSEDFSLTWGGGCEGEEKFDSKEVSFYVDRLCGSERESV